MKNKKTVMPKQAAPVELNSIGTAGAGAGTADAVDALGAIIRIRRLGTNPFAE